MLTKPKTCWNIKKQEKNVEKHKKYQTQQKTSKTWKKHEWKHYHNAKIWKIFYHNAKKYEKHKTYGSGWEGGETPATLAAPTAPTENRTIPDPDLTPSLYYFTQIFPIYGNISNFTQIWMKLSQFTQISLRLLKFTQMILISSKFE